MSWFKIYRLELTELCSWPSGRDAQLHGNRADNDEGVVTTMTALMTVGLRQLDLYVCGRSEPNVVENLLAVFLHQHMQISWIPQYVKILPRLSTSLFAAV